MPLSSSSPHSHRPHQNCFVRVCSSETDTPSDFFRSAPETGEIHLTRPKTTIRKTYRADALFHSAQDDEFFCQRISPRIESFVEGEDVLLWTFGTRGTGKTTALFGTDGTVGEEGWMGRISSRLAKEIVSERRVMLTVSYLCVTGDETDRSMDCLSRDGSSALRMREDPERGFYVDGLTDVIVQTEEDLRFVLSRGRANFLHFQNTARLHCLVTFTLHRFFSNGDVISSSLKILDVCGADRSATPARDATRKKGPRKESLKGRKEDKTLKAISRIVDKLSTEKPGHVPYRDCKMTRLIGRGMSGPSHNISLICVSSKSGMFDECAAMMDFVNKVRKISVRRPTVVRDNRLEKLDEAKSNVRRVADRLGMNVDGLESSEIELDMNSPMDLVELRDCVAKVELLAVDPFEAIRRKSDDWWSDVR